jgi:nicotinamide-nucleotide amidase
VEAEVGILLSKHRLTIGIAESATGGLLSHLITNVPGSSDYFIGSVVAYANEAKISILGVKENTIRQYGAVSRQTAEEMATGVKGLMNVDIALATTGIAGPSGAMPGKPLGLVYIALASEKGTKVREFTFQGDRWQNKMAFSEVALGMLKEELESWISSS